MIAHVLEVWALLAATFVLGCLIGAVAQLGLAHTPVAGAQDRAAAALAVVVHWFRQRLDVSPTWREYRYVPEPPAPRNVDAFDVRPPEPGPEIPSPEPLPAIDQEAPEEAALPPVDEVLSLPADDQPLPVPAEAVEEDTDTYDGPEPMRPAGLTAPRNGVPDDLQRIHGIGKKNEALLNSFGIYHYGQIAAWTPAEQAWIAERLAFPERAARDDWIGQAVVLASGGSAPEKAADRRRRRRAGVVRQIADHTETGEIGDASAAPEAPPDAGEAPDTGDDTDKP